MARSPSRRSTNRRPDCTGTTRPIAAMRTAATPGAAMSSSSKSIRDTFEVTPINVTAVAEIGKAIHPMMAIGQIEGGTAQGIGYALTEEVVMSDGRMANAQLTNYIIPTTARSPPMDIGILERPVPAWTVRREGRRRNADRRSRAGRDQRAPSLRLRCSRDSGDAGEDCSCRDMKFTLNGKAQFGVDVHSDEAAARCAARGLWPDRHQGRLRRRRVRRLHGADRRRAGEFVPRPGRARRQARASRRSKGCGGTPCAAARVRRARRRAVRHLHAGHDPRGRRARSGGFAATRSRPAWPGTSAAAPAIRLSSVQSRRASAYARVRR